MKLTLIDKKQETEDVTTFVFKTDSPLQWKAGQYLHYTLDHLNVDNRKTDRYFTISSAPYEQNIHLTTRITKERGSSFKNALQNLPIGATIEANDLEGDFTVDNPDTKMIFIAGGIGITPYRSILLDLAHRNLPINVTLLFGNRAARFVFKHELEALKPNHPNFKIHYFVEPQRIDEKSIRQAATNPPASWRAGGPIIYVSGPEPMVISFEKMLLAMGIADNHIKRDFFPGYDWP